jgi:hypothetical protein
MTSYITPEEACALIPGMTAGGLAQLRSSGTGPVFLKPSPRRIFYREADVIFWIENSEKSTSRAAA